MFSNKVYDILKFIAQIVLPALGTFIFALSSAWGGWPWAEPVVGTLTAIDVLLGTVLGISTHNYNKEQENHDQT
jgi:hypothetical protein